MNDSGRGGWRGGGRPRLVPDSGLLKNRSIRMTNEEFIKVKELLKQERKIKTIDEMLEETRQKNPESYQRIIEEVETRKKKFENRGLNIS